MTSTNKAAADLPWSGIRKVMTAASTIPGAIRLDIGDPTFTTPDHVTDAAHTAATAGRTHYTPSGGLPDLRAALTRKIQERNGYRVSRDQVIVTQGASQGIYATLLALAEPGDGVLLPDPAWPNYRTMAQLLRLDPEFYRLTSRSDFLPTLDELERLVTPRTKILLINFPGNPTGAIAEPARMYALVDFAERHDLWLVSDECYDEIIFGDGYAGPGTMNTDRVISAYSFSKTYAMTGWRIGYVTVPNTIADTVTKCQESLLACVNEPAQWAALAALSGPQGQVAAMRETYRSRAATVLDALRGTALVPAVPRGAFYVWLDVSSAGLPEEEFALRLLREHGVSVAPGNAFGAEGTGFIRLSLTASDVDIAEGVRRIVEFAQATTG